MKVNTPVVFLTIGLAICGFLLGRLSSGGTVLHKENGSQDVAVDITVGEGASGGEEAHMNAPAFLRMNSAVEGRHADAMQSVQEIRSAVSSLSEQLHESPTLREKAQALQSSGALLEEIKKVISTISFGGDFAAFNEMLEDAMSGIDHFLVGIPKIKRVIELGADAMEAEVSHVSSDSAPVESENLSVVTRPSRVLWETDPSHDSNSEEAEGSDGAFTAKPFTNRKTQQRHYERLKARHARHFAGDPLRANKHRHLSMFQEAVLNGDHEHLQKLLRSYHEMSDNLQPEKQGRRLQSAIDLKGRQCMQLVKCARSMSHYDALVYYYYDDIDEKSGEMDDYIHMFNERDLHAMYTQIDQISSALYNRHSTTASAYGSDPDCDKLLQLFHRNVEKEGLPFWEGGTVSQVCQAQGTQRYVRLKDVARNVGLWSANTIAKDLYTCSAELYNSNARTTFEPFAFGNWEPPEYSNSAGSYASKKNYCASKGKRLCTYREICPGGHKGGFAESLLGLNKIQANHEIYFPYLGDASKHCSGNQNKGLWLKRSDCARHTTAGEMKFDCPDWGLAESIYSPTAICCTDESGIGSSQQDTSVAFDTTWTQTADYAGTQSYCARKGKRMCSYKEICPNGVDGNVADSIFPVTSSDPLSKYVAISGDPSKSCGTDAANGLWVHVSRNGAYKTCSNHTKSSMGHDCPTWGAQKVSPHNLGQVCCDQPPPTAIDRSKTGSYKESEAFCASQGKRLCSYGEICPEGKLRSSIVGTAAPSDKWVAYGGPSKCRNDAARGMWLQIASGHKGWPTCANHLLTGDNAIGHDCPDWGTNPGNYNSGTLCCEKTEKADATPVVDVLPTNTMSYFYGRTKPFRPTEVSITWSGGTVPSYHLLASTTGLDNSYKKLPMEVVQLEGQGQQADSTYFHQFPSVTEAYVFLEVRCFGVCAISKFDAKATEITKYTGAYETDLVFPSGLKLDTNVRNEHGQLVANSKDPFKYEDKKNTIGWWRRVVWFMAEAYKFLYDKSLEQHELGDNWPKPKSRKLTDDAAGIVPATAPFHLSIYKDADQYLRALSKAEKQKNYLAHLDHIWKFVYAPSVAGGLLKNQYPWTDWNEFKGMANETDAVLESMEKGMKLVFGDKPSVGHLCGVKEAVVTNRGKYPGRCCLDAPFQNDGDNWGRVHDCNTPCKLEATFFAGISENACAAQGGTFCPNPTDCSALKLCVEEEEKRAKSGHMPAYAAFLKPGKVEDPNSPSDCGKARKYFGFDALFSNDEEICDNVRQLHNTKDFAFLNKNYDDADKSKAASLPSESAPACPTPAPVAQKTIKWTSLKKPKAAADVVGIVFGSLKIVGAAWKAANAVLDSIVDSISIVFDTLSSIECPGDPSGVAQTACSVLKGVSVGVVLVIFQVAKFILKISEFSYDVVIGDGLSTIKDIIDAATSSDTEVIYDNMIAIDANLRGLAEAQGHEIARRLGETNMTAIVEEQLQPLMKVVKGQQEELDKQSAVLDRQSTVLERLGAFMERQDEVIASQNKMLLELTMKLGNGESAGDTGN